MCGILFTNDPSISKRKFQQSLELLHHRGPDAEPGLLFVDNFKLGHNRLKILDLDDRSNQPFWSRDKRYAIIYNGEIYNYKELALKYGINQITTSDTEVIVELFALIGMRMLDEFNGMFALVILDTETKNIFVARDRLGIKPLYVSRIGEKITIASEISSVLKLTGKTEFDDIGLRQYRKLRTCFNNRTIYQGIEMFPAGHYMLSGKIQRYWHLSLEEKDPPEDDELRELIESAVKYRRISDVPVGSYLSGGLDSTIVAKLSDKPHTWSVGFTDSNEFYWADFAAKTFGNEHAEVLIEKDEFVELAKHMIQRRREPLSVPNEVLLYKMTKEVKKKNTVVLSGEGADELFFGYDRIFRWASRNEWNIEEFNKLYSYGSNDDFEIVEDALSPFLRNDHNALSIVASFFQIAHLHGLLRRVDNSTMLCSVEARVPFVDHRLVERLAGVSFDYRMKGGIVKAPLKRIFGDFLPEQITNREKVGFPVPLESIPFGIPATGKTMDRWLEFNLIELGVDIDDLR